MELVLKTSDGVIPTVSSNLTPSAKNTSTGSPVDVFFHCAISFEILCSQ